MSAARPERSIEEWKAELKLAPATLLLLELKQRDIAGEIELVSVGSRRKAGMLSSVLTLLVFLPILIVLWRWALG